MSVIGACTPSIFDSIPFPRCQNGSASILLCATHRGSILLSARGPSSMRFMLYILQALVSAMPILAEISPVVLGILYAVLFPAHDARHMSNNCSGLHIFVGRSYGSRGNFRYSGFQVNWKPWSTRSIHLEAFSQRRQHASNLSRTVHIYTRQIVLVGLGLHALSRGGKPLEWEWQ